MNDYYSQRIYQWLVDNKVADILRLLSTTLSDISADLKSFLYFFAFAFFVFLGLKFLRIRYTTL